MRAPLRPFASILACLLVVAIPAAAVPEDLPAAPPPLIGRDFAPNQPYSSYWYPDELLDWSPATDPDAPYNRSGVELRDRFTNPDFQVNAHARDGEGRIAALSIMYPSTSGNPSQGADVFDVYAFGYWQYVDILCMWGGSAGEGLILSPSADVIDAAHRNGVPVLGTIFFPPTVYGGQIQWVWDLLQRQGLDFPVADKLIEVADYYGFDGWFLNQETAGGNATMAAEMQDFLRYFQEHKSPGMHMMWYDSMISSGAISWQNELNSLNQMFFEDGGRISDDFFLNFWWSGTTNLADSRALALALGRDPYEVYAGVDVQANGYGTSVDWARLFPEMQEHTVSLGFYGTEWPFSSSSSHADYLQRANRFWVGANRDPSNTSTSHPWKGLAHYVPAKSVIDERHFVTHFNAGQGHFYAIGGEVLRDGDWNNRSLQDVLPTWRWLVEADGQALYPQLDFTDALDGGSCLKVSGDLLAGITTHVKLYKTSIEVLAGSSLEVVFKGGGAGQLSNMLVGLTFEDTPTVQEFLPVGPFADGWATQTFDLSSYAGRTIGALSLYFFSPTTVTGYEMKVGRLAVYDGAIDIPAAPSNTYIDDLVMLSARSAAVRLRWDHSPDPVYTYHLYRVNPDSSRTFLGGTPNNALFVSEIERIDAEVSTVIEVEPVSPEFGHGPVDTTSVFWGFEPPNDPPECHANGPYCGVAGEPLSLSSRGSYDPDGTIETYAWSFGDGGTSDEPMPVHTYAAVGTYTVILALVDNLGGTSADTTTASITSEPLSQHPDIAWFEFETGSGSIAYDTSGNGNDGSIYGATWDEGVIGDHALRFDGVNDWVLVADFPRPTSTMTVSVWAFAESRPNWASMVKNWAGPPGAFHLGLRESDGDLDVQVGEASGSTVFVREGADTPFPLEHWIHVAVVADGALVRLYRDGLEVGQVPYDGTLITSRPGLGIGVKLNDAGSGPNPWVPGYWHGLLDDVRIYERALCQNEIEAMWLAGVGTTGIGPAGGRLPQLRFALGQNHPNPFNPVTEIRFSLPRAAGVSLVVYDVAGRRIVELASGHRDAGDHVVRWDGRDHTGRSVSSGVYFYVLRTGDLNAVRRMLLVK